MNQNHISTPYFTLSKKALLENLNFINQFKSQHCFNLLYSVKSLSHRSALDIISQHTDGFSVSSVFEAQLSKLHTNKSIHLVSPIIKPDEVHVLSKLCDKITFNSLEQFERFKNNFQNLSLGLRINPGLSLLKEDRYNPCKKFSKLGIPMLDIKRFFTKNIHPVQGLHIHTNCEGIDLKNLINTMTLVEKSLGSFMEQLTWFNLGGGYFFNKDTKNLQLFFKYISKLRAKYNLDIIMEPGGSISKTSMTLTSSVIDIISRDGKNIAILDTTVNHLPEVFEYQYPPQTLGHNKTYKNHYILAGRTCLAGDVFRTCSFKNKLQLGDLIVFQNVGSYSLVKATMFNGIKLPSFYCLDQNDQLNKITDCSFKDYLNLYKKN